MQVKAPENTLQHLKSKSFKSQIKDFCKMNPFEMQIQEAHVAADLLTGVLTDHLQDLFSKFQWNCQTGRKKSRTTWADIIGWFWLITDIFGNKGSEVTESRKPDELCLDNQLQYHNPQSASSLSAQYLFITNVWSVTLLPVFEWGQFNWMKTDVSVCLI